MKKTFLFLVLLICNVSFFIEEVTARGCKEVAPSISSSGELLDTQACIDGDFLPILSSVEIAPRAFVASIGVENHTNWRKKFSSLYVNTTKGWKRIAGNNRTRLLTPGFSASSGRLCSLELPRTYSPNIACASVDPKLVQYSEGIVLEHFPFQLPSGKREGRILAVRSCTVELQLQEKNEAWNSMSMDSILVATCDDYNVTSEALPSDPLEEPLTADAGS